MTINNGGDEEQLEHIWRVPKFQPHIAVLNFVIIAVVTIHLSLTLIDFSESSLQSQSRPTQMRGRIGTNSNRSQYTCFDLFCLRPVIPSPSPLQPISTAPPTPTSKTTGYCMGNQHGVGMWVQLTASGKVSDVAMMISPNGAQRQAIKL